MRCILGYEQQMKKPQPAYVSSHCTWPPQAAIEVVASAQRLVTESVDATMSRATAALVDAVAVHKPSCRGGSGGKPWYDKLAGSAKLPAIDAHSRASGFSELAPDGWVTAATELTTKKTSYVELCNRFEKKQTESLITDTEKTEYHLRMTHHEWLLLALALSAKRSPKEKRSKAFGIKKKVLASKLKGETKDPWTDDLFKPVRVAAEAMLANGGS